MTGWVVLALLCCSSLASAQTCVDLASDDCALPAVFTHSVVVEEDGIRTTFAPSVGRAIGTIGTIGTLKARS